MVMELKTIVSNYSDFFYFFKKSYPNSIFHNSSIFHRDIQYVLTDYIMKREKKMLPVGKSDILAKEVEKAFEKNNIFKKIDDRTWVLNYPDFVTQNTEKK
jgi:hypothetical protein